MKVHPRGILLLSAAFVCTSSLPTDAEERGQPSLGGTIRGPQKRPLKQDDALLKTLFRGRDHEKQANRVPVAKRIKSKARVKDQDATKKRTMKDHMHQSVIKTECDPSIDGRKDGADIGILGVCGDECCCMETTAAKTLGGFCRRSFSAEASSITSSSRSLGEDSCSSPCSRFVTHVGSHSGLAPNRGEGCCNSSCEAKVCAVNSDCCNQGWSFECADLAHCYLSECHGVDDCAPEELTACDGGAEPGNCAQGCSEHTSSVLAAVQETCNPLDCDVHGCLEKICAARPGAHDCCADFNGWRLECFDLGFNEDLVTLVPDQPCGLCLETPPSSRPSLAPSSEPSHMPSSTPSHFPSESPSQPPTELRTPGEICGHTDTSNSCKGDKIQVCIETTAGGDGDRRGLRHGNESNAQTVADMTAKTNNSSSRNLKKKKGNRSPFKAKCVDPNKHLKSDERVERCGGCEILID